MPSSTPTATEKGVVVVSLKQQEKRAVLEVRDQGSAFPGISKFLALGDKAGHAAHSHPDAEPGRNAVGDQRGGAVFRVEF